MKQGSANFPMKIEQAVYIASLPYRRAFFKAGGWRAGPGPGQAGWKSFLRESYSPLERAAAKNEVEKFRNRPARRSAETFSVNIWDEFYPPPLKEIYDPPPVLFIRSNLPGFNEENFRELLAAGESLAVVGTRNPAPIVRYAAEELLRQETRTGTPACLVSGFARGVDALAHENAIKNSIPNLAVLGAGLDYAGPRGNLALPERARRAKLPFLLISEFAPHVPGHARNFPRRNRIIAGLVTRLIVLQAPWKSGALISARYALEEGRDVAIFDHELLKGEGFNEGARAMLADGAQAVHLPGLDARIVLEPPFQKVRGQASRRGVQLEFWRKKNAGQLRPLGNGRFIRVREEEREREVS